MSNTFWNKKIPTLLAMALLVIGVGATSYLVRIGVIPFIGAAPDETPQEVRVTNITDTSLTVTYTTAADVIGSVAFGKDASFGQLALDDRDQASGTPTFHTVHSITLRDLSPQTTYFFKITSGTTNFLNNDQPFQATTGKVIGETPTSANPITGTITLPDGTSPQEALIYVTVGNGQTLSALTKSGTGVYLLPLNTMRTADLASYIDLNPQTPIQILVKNNSTISEVTTAIQGVSPLPIITLGYNYNFSQSQTPIASTAAALIGFPAFSLNNTTVATPEIQSPTENETFTDAQPLFQGQAPANATVSITIHSGSPIQTTVIADSNGTWNFRPNIQLAPGVHTLTVKAPDANGIIHTLVQTFTILAAGTQVAEAATPSATLAPTKIPTPTQVAPTVTATPIPSVITPTPQAEQTITTPVPTIMTTKGGLPATGSNAGVTIGTAGILTSIVGIILFIVTKGASL